jgi:general secretion pathway protein F
MPVYQYKGLTAKGKTISGVAEASGPFELQKRLAQENIYLTEVGEAKVSVATASGASVLRKEVSLRSVFERVRQSDVAIMTRQLATLLRASVPMSEALQALVAQQENKRFRAVLATVREKVREGSSLADALSEHKEAFSDLYVNMVRVGEASGTLDIVLSRLADFLESSVRLRSKIIAAMIYPILMVCVAFVIVTIMMLFVIPKVTEMFEEMGGQLPLVTRILIAISHTFANTWFIVFPLLGVGVYYLRRYTRTEKGRLWADSLVLRIPVFGATIRLIAVARFARTLATLLNGGVPVLTALDIAKNIVNNVVLAKAIEEARLAVREGESIAKPLEKSGQFPPMMTHMIAIGEQSGQVEEMLLNVADAYDSEVENKVTTLTAVLEPVMIVGMGLMVTFLVFAILMPMLKMNEVIVGH